MVLDPHSKLLLSNALVKLARAYTKLKPGRESAMQLQNAERVLKETMRQCGPRLVEGNET